MGNKVIPAYLGNSEADFKLLGLKKGQIEPWEDGMRTNGGKGTYEWWYFDAHLDDGSKLVITFYTKFYTEINKPLKPLVTINWDTPDGQTVERKFYTTPADFSASQKCCELSIGPNTFQGDLNQYLIHLAIEDLVCDVTLTRTAPSWRPDTGHLLFGERAEYFFAWLPSVPQGMAQVKLRLGDREQHLTGIGYHDHNWGNISMLKLMNNWYWARGAIGPYTVIASYITTEKKYGYQTIPVFLLAKDGQILADDGSKVHFEATEFYQDSRTGKPVANLMLYDYEEGDRRYRLIFRREKDILRVKLTEMVDKVSGLLARLIGFDGAYLRFVGDLKLECFHGGQAVETLHDEVIWELMYFGHVPREKTLA